METALHVSGGTTAHHQERKELYLQHLVFVTPVLLPAAIAAGSSNGLINTRCCRYSHLRSWWNFEIKDAMSSYSFLLCSKCIKLEKKSRPCGYNNFSERVALRAIRNTLQIRRRLINWNVPTFQSKAALPFLLKYKSSDYKRPPSQDPSSSSPDLVIKTFRAWWLKFVNFFVITSDIPAVLCVGWSVLDHVTSHVDTIHLFAHYICRELCTVDINPC
jgi:hypothetical protein